MEAVKKQLIVFTVLVLLAAGGIAALLTYSDLGKESFSYVAEGEGEGGQFLSEESIENWLNYDGEEEISSIEGFTPEVFPLKESDISELESVLANSSYGGGPPEGGGGESTLGSEGDERSEEAGGEGEPERAVEEGDIVKLSGDRLYILSYYRGFLVVDVSDPEDLRVVSHVGLKGHPVEMYVHEPLAVVVLTRGFSWYGGGGTLVAVLNMRNEQDIKVVKYITVKGYASVSRLVGDVLYIATIPEFYYYPVAEVGVGVKEGGVAEETEESYEYGDEEFINEPQRTVLISSIDLSSPEGLGVVDNLTLRGESVQVHATSRAIFVATGEARWNERDGEYVERTTIHYVDISDEGGKIKLRGQVTLTGSVWDKYQMDYYGGTLRVITHRNSWETQGSSYLSIIDVRDPDHLRVLGGLSVDEAGNLMAVRFSGTRLYLIHLPYAPDPLRVVDLSDPTSPELCSVLEIPGWVEHMEVVGDTIVAIGVNNTEGFRVSVYLFDVTDPHEPVLKDRLSVGQYSTSEALWEPKAVTLLKERSLLIIPFTDHSGNGGRNGLLLIKYTSEKLTLWGEVNSPEIVRRSRVKDDYVLGTSERICISIDIGGEVPEVADILPLTENYYQLLSLPGGVGALVEVLGVHYFRYITDGGDVQEVALPEDFSSDGYGWTRGFAHGEMVLLVRSPYPYRYYYEDEQPRGTHLAVLKIENGRPVLKQGRLIEGLYSSSMIELSDGRVLLYNPYYRVYYGEYEGGDEVEGRTEEEKMPEGSVSYLIDYSSESIMIEEIEMDEYYYNLLPLESGLYATETDWSYYRNPVTRIYLLDLESGNRTYVGEIPGWIATGEGRRVATELWEGDSHRVNVYEIEGTTIQRVFSMEMRLWGGLLLRDSSLYIVNNYVYHYPPLKGEYSGEYPEGMEDAPSTAIIRVDLPTGKVAAAVLIRGNFWPYGFSGGEMLLSGYFGDGSFVGVLDSSDLSRKLFAPVPTPPLDMEVYQNTLHVVMGEFGYIALEME